jgi:hypothetical protein
MLTRRELLSMTAALPFARFAEADDRPARIRALIREFELQGIHRTGTDVDRRSAEWLAREVKRIGLTPMQEAFHLERVDVATVALRATSRQFQFPEEQVSGLPLFDGAFTGADGVRGTLYPDDGRGRGEMILVEGAPNAAGTGALGRARRSGLYRGIVCITQGGRPGLCPSNADSFLSPFGPPVLQISSVEADWLRLYAQATGEIQIVAHVKRKRVEAFNVTATLAGRDRSLPPLVVMTPRSGWWTCASERGGGIACWLELMRELKKAPGARDVVFVASSGHELGHLGINAFVDRRPDIVKKSAGWIHLGANIGAAQDPGNTIQASDDEFESRQADAMTAAGLAITRRNPRGTVPGGEAEVVHRGGGRYVSVIGRNALFHNPADHGPEAVDANAIARFVGAMTQVAHGLIA